MIQLNRQTFVRLWRLLRPFFTSEVKWQARGLAALLICFALSIVGINAVLNYQSGEIMNNLELKERDAFFRALMLFLLCHVVNTLIIVFQSFTEQRTALLWRLVLSRHILRKYFNNLSFYRIGFYEGIDNPDQRIEEDIRNFASNMLSFMINIFNSCLTFVMFIGILSTISFNLVMAVVVYAGFGTLIAYLIGKPLISLNFAQLKKEADYRYKLVNVRDHAESIAFYRGERKELTRTRQRLKDALDNSLRIIRVNRNLNFFITPYNLLKPVLPLVIVSPLYLSGEIRFGDIGRATDAFVRVVEALSILIQNFNLMSGLIAVVTRLGTFTEALDEAGSNKVPTKGPLIESCIEPRIAFMDVSIVTPKRDQVLVKELSFELKSGGLLIVGGSGNGKSSILRVLSGLWNAGEGRVVRPNLRESIFLPQRSYLVLGTLRNQLLYSLERQGISDRELFDVMRRVGLETTVERVGGLGAVANWQSLLSAGEQQQLAFARLLLARPKFAFVDEATTACDAATEAHLYDILTRTTTAFVSIGYRATLARFHRFILEIHNDGTWYLERQTRGR